tara:strand:+ start:6312 stop:6704 length:393 start_codon:yes stop_codon:yes gene_type:complete
MNELLNLYTSRGEDLNLSLSRDAIGRASGNNPDSHMGAEQAANDIIEDSEALFNYFNDHWDLTPTFEFDLAEEVVFSGEGEWDRASQNLYCQNHAFEDDDNMRILLNEFADTGLLRHLGDLLTHLEEFQG